MKVAIQSPYITLGQFLKLVNLVQSGEQAKAFVVGNQIQVNGVLTRQRGRKYTPAIKWRSAAPFMRLPGDVSCFYSR